MSKRLASEELLVQASALALMLDERKPGELLNAIADAYDAEEQSCLYFIRQGSSGPIKIGRASSPHRRREELQGGNHEQLVLLAYFAGGARVERLAHEAFSELHIRGEWFRAERPLLDFISMLEQVEKEAA